MPERDSLVWHAISDKWKSRTSTGRPLPPTPPPPLNLQKVHRAARDIRASETQKNEQLFFYEQYKPSIII